MQDTYVELNNKLSGYGRLATSFFILKWGVVVIAIIGIIALIVGSIGLKEAEHPKSYTIDDFMEDDVLKIDGTLEANSVNIIVPSTSEGIVGIPIDSSIKITKQISLDSEIVEAVPFRVSAYLIAHMVTMSGEAWSGNCMNTSTSVHSVGTLPIEFIQTKDGTAVDTAPTLVPVINNDEFKTGAVYLSSEGYLVFVPNSNDDKEKWGGNCATAKFNLSYLRYI